MAFTMVGLLALLVVGMSNAQYGAPMPEPNGSGSYSKPPAKAGLAFTCWKSGFIRNGMNIKAACDGGVELVFRKPDVPVTVKLELYWSENNKTCNDDAVDSVDPTTSKQLWTKTVMASDMKDKITRYTDEVSGLIPAVSSNCVTGCFIGVLNDVITLRQPMVVECIAKDFDLSIQAVQTSRVAEVVWDESLQQASFSPSSILSSVSVSLATSGPMSELKPLDPDWPISAGCWIRPAESHMFMSNAQPSFGGRCGPVLADPIVTDESIVVQYTARSLAPSTPWSLDLSKNVIFGESNQPINGSAVLVCAVDFNGDFVKYDKDPCNNFVVFNISVVIPAGLPRFSGLTLFPDVMSAGHSGFVKTFNSHSPSHEAKFFRYSAATGSGMSTFMQLNGERSFHENFGSLVGLRRAQMWALAHANDATCSFMADDKAMSDQMQNENTADKNPSTSQAQENCKMMGGNAADCLRIAGVMEKQKCPSKALIQKIRKMSMKAMFLHGQEQICSYPVRGPQDVDLALPCAFRKLIRIIMRPNVARRIMRDIIPDEHRVQSGGHYMSYMDAFADNDFYQACPAFDSMMTQTTMVGGYPVFQNGTLFFGVPGKNGQDVCWTKMAVLRCDQCMNGGSYPSHYPGSSSYYNSYSSYYPGASSNYNSYSSYATNMEASFGKK